MVLSPSGAKKRVRLAEAEKKKKRGVLAVEFIGV